MSFEGSIINDSFFNGDVSSSSPVLRTPERRPTVPVQNAPARPIQNPSAPPIQIESVEIDPINNRLIFDDALVDPVTSNLPEDEYDDYSDDHSDDKHDEDHDDDHEDQYIHYCGNHTCYGDCGVLSCGCIDTCRRHCENDYDDYDDY